MLITEMQREMHTSEGSGWNNMSTWHILMSRIQSETRDGHHIYLSTSFPCSVLRVHWAHYNIDCKHMFASLVRLKNVTISAVASGCLSSFSAAARKRAQLCRIETSCNVLNCLETGFWVKSLSMISRDNLYRLSLKIIVTDPISYNTKAAHTVPCCWIGAKSLPKPMITNGAPLHWYSKSFCNSCIHRWQWKQCRGALCGLLCISRF